MPYSNDSAQVKCKELNRRRPRQAELPSWQKTDAAQDAGKFPMGIV
jgi:hypothetical protein